MYVVIHVEAGIVDMCLVYEDFDAAEKARDKWFMALHSRYDMVEEYNANSHNQLVIEEAVNG